MDPFDEFEFKPLTEGLGFHRKKTDLKEEVKNTRLVRDSIAPNIPKPPKALFNLEESKPLNFKSPLPRLEDRPLIEPAITPSGTTEDTIDELVRSFRRPVADFIENTEVAAKQKPSGWSIFPFAIDSMLVVALTLVCLIISLTVTKIDFLSNIANPQTDIGFFLTMPAVVLGMALIYVMISRAFVGATLGEAVFDVQAGTDEQRESGSYTLRTMARALLVAATGFVILPTLSLLFGRDLSGQITGTVLVRRD